MPGSSAGFTSPLSLFDSPSEGYDTSPLFHADDLAENWYPLFPDAAPSSEEGAAVVKAKQHPVDGSPSSTDSPDTSPRFRSSSVSSSNTKRSSTSGVRKRATPLPPIVVDNPHDIVAVKRARNTLAARKSRAKKAEKMEDMSIMIEELRAEVQHWKDLYHRQIGQ